MAISLDEAKKKKTTEPKEENVSLVDMVVENDDINDEDMDDIDVEKPNIMDKASDKINNISFIQILKENKKDTMVCAIILVIGLVLIGIFSFAKSIFGEELMAQNKKYNDLQNSIHELEITNDYKVAAGAGENIESYNVSNTATNINWIGDKVDVARWMTDESYFWTWIEPAFSYSSATEYNEMKATYYQALGSCYFTTSFLAPYDHTTDLSFDANRDGQLSGKETEAANVAFSCDTNKSKFFTYPIGEKMDGSYEYLALVPMHSKGSSQYIMVAFTYEVIHNTRADGAEEIVISNFNCWAPDKEALYVVY